MDTATNTTTTIATTQAKGIKVKLSRNIYVDAELNRNELWSPRLLIKWQNNSIITAYNIKLDLSG